MMTKIQGCTTINMILNLIVFAGGTLFLLLWRGPLVAIAYAAAYLLYISAYTRVFPKISKYLGYGELKDES